MMQTIDAKSFVSYLRDSNMTFVAVIPIVQILFLVVVWLDIYVIRQIVAFFFLMLIPGFLILDILCYKRRFELSKVEILLFSFGLSIFFIMILGLIINEILPFIGILNPLTYVNLMFAVNISVFILFLADFLVKRYQGFSCNTQSLTRCASTPLRWSLLALFLPVLSIFGVFQTLLTSYNVITILILATILVVFLTAIHKNIDNRTCIILLLAFSLALILQKSLISDYIRGYDIQGEYYVFVRTLNNSKWTPISFRDTLTHTYSSFNTMLSDTLLPTVYAILLGVDPTTVLRIVYPVLYSLLPIGIYHWHRSQVGKKFAFLSAFFFMVNYDTFLQPLGNSKQMIAEIFFVLLFIVLIDERWRKAGFSRSVCLLMMSFGLITSHYATSYLFLALITSVWVFGQIKKNIHQTITLRYILLFFTVAFGWYIYSHVSETFDKVIDLVNSVYQSFFVEFLSVQSRGSTVTTVLEQSTPLHVVSRVLFIITQVIIVLGVIELARRKIGINLKQEYKALLYVGVLLLLMTILIPNVAPALKLDRFYGILLVVFAPLFAMGTQAFSARLGKRHKKMILSSIIVIVIVPFFLFQTGILYEVANDPEPSNPSLSISHMGDTPYTDLAFVRRKDVWSSVWLSENIRISDRMLYADVVSRFLALKSYGMIPESLIAGIIRGTTLQKGSYVYLATYNGSALVQQRGVLNSTQTFFSENVYSNGATIIQFLLSNSTVP